MNLEEIREIAYKHLGKRKAHNEREVGFIYYHGQRVAKLALHLRELIIPSQPEFDEVITVACWVHDIAKGIEPHWEYGSLLAKDILAEYCTAKELTQITEIVRCHPFRKDTKSYPDYVKLVQDADMLDHFGVLEIWMNFMYRAHDGGALMDSVEFYKTEYTEHACACRGLLKYKESLEIFDEKDRFVREFAKRMEVEAVGDIVKI